jgi:hypothetical protein
MTQAIETTARHATLQDLADALKSQEAIKEDLIVGWTRVSAESGEIVVDGATALGEPRNYRLTKYAERDVAQKLGIPSDYLTKLRNTPRLDLWDANVDGWINGDYKTATEPKGGNVMLRTFLGDVGDPGILRAVLSDRYGIIDNFDALTAVLEGIKETGTSIDIVSADLTETRMTVKIAAPEIMVNASDLLAGYRSPFGDGGTFDHSGGRSVHYGRGALPQHWQDKYGVNADGVFAGLVVTNSEIGAGSFSIVPRLMVLRCTNGLMITRDAMRRVHLGGKLEEGTVKWSTETQQRMLALVTSQAKDAVQAFLDPDYVEMTLDGLTNDAAEPILAPSDTIQFVAKTLKFTEAQTQGVLDHFIKGGQVTAGGVMQAVSSYAQTLPDADEAFDLESVAVDAMLVAAAA